MADTAFQILSEIDPTPMHYARLMAKALQRIAIQDPRRKFGKTPENTLNTALSKDRRFRRVGPGTWALAESRDKR